MIVKGNARGGGAQLAAHLMNAHDNESVELADARGSIAGDIAGAFAEWRAQASATACEKYLYSLSVNPDQAQGRMSREDYFEFLSRVEQSLGLDRQGRVVVFHEKLDRDGTAREHCHAVWSRIDARAGRAVQLSHDRMKLRTVSQTFARELGRQLPRGMDQDRGAERHEARRGHRNLREQQQEERSGIPKEERRATIAKAWRTAKDGAGFVAALQEAGYMIARGDRRAFVVVDRAGEVHSLGRQIEGVRSKEIADRLTGSTIAVLPSVQEAVAAMQSRREAAEQRHRASPVPASDRRQATLRSAQQARQAQFAAERAEMTRRQKVERETLHEAQRLSGAFDQARTQRRIPAFIRRTVAKVQQRYQATVLARRHEAEQRDFDRRERALTALDKREQWSLATRQRKEQFQAQTKETERRRTALQLPGGMAERSPSQAPERSNDAPIMSAEERGKRLRQAFSPERTPAERPQLPRVPEIDREAEQRAEALRRAQERKPER